jgi:hypothetical protein
MDARNYEAKTTLKDGRDAIIRGIRPDDKAMATLALNCGLCRFLILPIVSSSFRSLTYSLAPCPVFGVHRPSTG